MAKQLSYDEIKHRAGCGWRIRDLTEILAIQHPCDPAGPLGDFDSKECHVIGTRLMGIESVLDLLASPPNAYVNCEALDEFQSHVTRAAAILLRANGRETLDLGEGLEWDVPATIRKVGIPKAVAQIRIAT